MTTPSTRGRCETCFGLLTWDDAAHGLKHCEPCRRRKREQWTEAYKRILGIKRMHGKEKEQ